MATVPRLKPRREDLKADEVLCQYCSAKCCRYFALPIDTPSDRRDFEFLRWYLLHGRATVFVDEGTWYLMVHTECKHLGSDNRCGIYNTRPEICREYSTDNCEYEDDWTYEQYFETAEQIGEYADAVLPKAKGANLRSPEPPLFHIL